MTVKRTGRVAPIEPAKATMIPKEALGAIRFSELGMLRITDRAAWRERVAGAIQENGGNRTYAAKALGVSLSRLQKWLKADGVLRRMAGPGKDGRPFSNGEGA
jgi:hypothetical protein